MERREVYYRGHVQGVGFRYTTREIARRFDVQGVVENLLDGRVRVMVEGESAEVERFLAAVQKRMQPYLLGVEQFSSPATGEFSGFEIRLARV
jgi:acylphosphatase